MKLLLDEMLPDAVAEQLRRRGHDAICVTEDETLRSEPDAVLFAFAQSAERVVVTENIGDFRRIAASLVQQGGQHAGIILTPNSVFPRGDSRTVGRLVRSLEAVLQGEADMTNQELWLSPPD